jgi:hypothetical protein
MGDTLRRVERQADENMTCGELKECCRCPWATRRLCGRLRPAGSAQGRRSQNVCQSGLPLLLSSCYKNTVVECVTGSSPFDPTRSGRSELSCCRRQPTSTTAKPRFIFSAREPKGSLRDKTKARKLACTVAIPIAGTGPTLRRLFNYLAGVLGASSK